MSEIKNLPIAFIQNPISLMRIGEVGFVAPTAIKILYEVSDTNKITHYYVINLHYSYNLVEEERLAKIKRLSEDDFEVDLTNPHIAYAPSATVPDEWKSYTTKKPVEVVYIYTQQHFSYFTYYEIMGMYNAYLEDRKEKIPECIWCLEILLSYTKAVNTMRTFDLDVIWDICVRTDLRIKEIAAIKIRNEEQENGLKINKVENKASYAVLEEKITQAVQVDNNLLEEMYRDIEEKQNYPLLSLLVESYPQLKSSTD